MNYHLEIYKNEYHLEQLLAFIATYLLLICLNKNVLKEE